VRGLEAARSNTGRFAAEADCAAMLETQAYVLAIQIEREWS